MDASRPLRHPAWVSIVVVFWLAFAELSGRTAHADEAVPPTPSAVAPRPTAEARPRWTKPVGPPLPVQLSVIAASPDPPWLLRIENAGQSPIRIPADVRLLTLEVSSAKKKATTKCSVPAALRPSQFPRSRELYVQPGDSYEEAFDPRLLCFGDAMDLLREGAVVKPRFGFGALGPQGPFAAQGTDRPEAFAPLRELVGKELTLPAVPAPPPAPAAAARKPEPTPARPKDGGGAGSKADGSAPEAPASVTDRNAPAFDIYVSRHSDAAAARDIVMTIRAVNEGRRELLTVVRSRMLAFRVEVLGPDNRAVNTVECRGQDAPHAIPVEAVRDVDPGQTVQVPILLAEVCPRDTFSRPGLFRVTARLDPTVGGEGAKKNPHVGEALGRQSALIRVATAKDPFYAARPLSSSESRAAAVLAESHRRDAARRKLEAAARQRD